MADKKLPNENVDRTSVLRKSDVTELYLANRDLEKVGDLSQFKHLKRVWLNGNKLRKIDFLRANYCITEIYLQDNLLIEITGALRHLSGLEVLMLQGNQLKQLTDVVLELKRMQRLRVLNLFGNPLAQEYDYRNYVIHSIPSLKLLDRQEILKDDREKARKKYGDAFTEKINNSLAFGRRVPDMVHSTSVITNDRVEYPCQQRQNSLRAGMFQDREVGSSMKARSDDIHFDSSEGNMINIEAPPRRSIMEYSSFDWSSVPSSEKKRLDDNSDFTPSIVRMYIR